MPLYKEFSTQDTALLVWKHQPDTESWVDDLSDASNRSVSKQYEKLMIRKMLQSALPNHQLCYEDNGSPYVEPLSAKISISHSYPFAVLAISNQNIGIDIEKRQPKILKIKSKFLSDTELKWLNNNDDLALLTIIWSIKESLYKIHPKKLWSFRVHYHIEEFSLSSLDHISCHIIQDEEITHYKASVQLINTNYVLTAVSEV